MEKISKLIDKNEVKSFGETLTELAEHKANTLSEDEYHDWLCELSEEFTLMALNDTCYKI